MTIRIQCVCIDSIDPQRLATFWMEALSWRQTFADEDQIALEPPMGSREDGVVPDLLFIRTRDGRVTKNRLHLDLRPTDQSEEVSRLMNLGAKRCDIGQPADCSWTVMVDPEGNEFCVLRPFTPEELATIED